MAEEAGHVDALLALARCGLGRQIDQCRSDAAAFAAHPDRPTFQPLEDESRALLAALEKLGAALDDLDPSAGLDDTLDDAGAESPGRSMKRGDDDDHPSPD